MEEKKYKLKEFPQEIQTELFKKFLLEISFIIASIVFSISFKSLEILIISLVMQLFLLFDIIRLYSLFRDFDNKIQYFDAVCKKTTKENLVSKNSKIGTCYTYFEFGDSLFKITTKPREGLTPGSIVRIYINKGKGYLNSENVWIINPIFYSITKKNIDTISTPVEK